MLIEINRIYVGSGLEAKILVNLRYARRIETLTPSHTHYNSVRTVIVMDDGIDTSLVYTNDSLSILKSKITKARKEYLK